MTRAVSELAKHFHLYGLSYEEACVIEKNLIKDMYFGLLARSLNKSDDFLVIWAQSKEKNR